jgi:hypothetical protein
MMFTVVTMHHLRYAHRRAHAITPPRHPAMLTPACIAAAASVVYYFWGLAGHYMFI